MIIPMFYYVDGKSYNDIHYFLTIYKVGIRNPTPLKRISTSRLRGTREEMGNFNSLLFFSLSSSFVFTMMTPLHFAHFDHFTPRDTSQSIKDLDRILSVT
jgi:hypothetical protein